MTDRTFIDMSGWNLYKAGTPNALTAFVAKRTPDIISEEDAYGKFRREWSRVPIGTGRVQRMAMTATATSGLVYVPPDFAAMQRDDPRHPQCVYLKAAHGTAGPGTADQYPIDDYVRPALLALEAQWGLSPYHFSYMDMDAGKQAACLVNSIAAKAAGNLKLFGTGDPVIDLEDNKSAMYKSFAWDGKSDPSRQIANVKYYLGSVLKKQILETDRLMGLATGRAIWTRMYSGPWFWNPMMQLLMLEKPGGGYWPEHQAIFDFYNKRMAISAWYSSDHKPFRPAENQKMLMIQNAAVQYTSTAVPPMIGLNVPGMDGKMGSSLDLNLFLGTDVEYAKFMGVPLIDAAPLPPPPDPDELARLKALEAAVKALEAVSVDTKADVNDVLAKLTALEGKLAKVKEDL